MPTIKEIVDLVASQTGVTRDDILGMKRDKHISRPRHMAMTLAREFTNFSLPQLGMKFYRDHTMILHAKRNVARLEADVPFIAKQMKEMRAKLRGDEPAADRAVEVPPSVAAENLLRKQWSVSAVLTTVPGGV